jgi:hypothetical protein
MGLKEKGTGRPDWSVQLFVEGKSYIRNGTVAVGNTDPATAYNTADTHNVRAYLGHLATSGFILNKSNTATLFIWISIDGVNFYGTGAGEGVDKEYTLVAPNTGYDLERATAYSFKIGANANNTPYIINMI